MNGKNEELHCQLQILPDRETWLQNRLNAIGGSEISACIGCNPYLDNVTLWELKTGRRQAEDISDKPCVQYGTQAEMHLRELFRLDYPQYQVEYVDNNSWTNTLYPWAAASLDGWLADETRRRGILEIKTSEPRTAQQKEKWKGRIPQNYYCQCLFYMAMLEADFCVLRAHLKTPDYATIRDYTIERHEVEDDIKHLMQAGAEFWEYVKNDTRPPLVLPEF